MELNFRVRSAEQSDVLFFYQSVVAGNNYQGSSGDFLQVFKQKLLSSATKMLVVELVSRSENVGLIVVDVQYNLTDTRPVYEIKEFFIVAEYRNYNTADILYEYFESSLKNQANCIIRVCCNIHSSLMHRFYSRKQFAYAKKLYIKELQLVQC